MKKEFLILLICLIIIYPNCFGQKINKRHGAFKATVFWAWNVSGKLRKHNNISLKVKEILKVDTDTIKHITKYEIIKNKNSIALIHDNEAFYFNDSIAYAIYKYNKECFRGKRSGKYGSMLYGQYIFSDGEYMDFYIHNKNTHSDFNSIRDTIINSIPYKVLQWNKKNSYSLNEKTGKFDIPDFYLVEDYYNCNKKIVDYICAKPLQIKGNGATFKFEYYIDTVSFENREKEVASMFDLNKPEYKNYRHHNDYFLPYSWDLINTKTKILTDSILNFPLVSVKGDTTTIAKQNNWLLLDFWFFGCPSCNDWLNKIKDEKDSLSYRVLEKNGIKIFSINAITHNIQKMQDEAKEFEAQDLLFRAEGLGKLIEMSTMPKFYLISPDKKIVYTSNNLNDYSELLKAKREYDNNK